MILEWLDGLSARLWRAARESRLLTALSRESGAPERLGGAFGFLEDRADGPAALPAQARWQFRFRRRVLCWQQESLLRRGIREACGWMLRGSVGSYGVFLLIFGTVSLCVYWLTGNVSPASTRMLVPLIAVICSLPLLHSLRSCSWAIRRGWLLRRFLLDFCGLPESSFGREDRGEERRLAPVLPGILAGLLTVFLHPGLVAALFALPPAAALLASVPELALLGVMLVFPFLGLGAHPSALLAGLLLVCDLLWAGKLISGRRQAGFGRTDLLVLLLAALFAGAGLVGSAGTVSGGLLPAFLLVSAWVPVRALSGSALWQRRCVCALLTGMTGCALLGLWQYFSGRAELRWLDLSRFGDVGGRVSVLFGNPNLLAVFLLLALPPALGELLAPGGSLPRRLFAGAAFVTGSLCLLLTWSRGAWLGWLTALLLMLLLHSRRSLSCLLLLPLPLAAGLPLLPHSVVNRFGSIGSLSESSARFRWYTWRGVLRLLRARPWGVGAGEAAFRAVYPAYAVSGTERVMHTHQLFLQTAVQLGLPGLLVLLLILWQLLRRTAAFCRRKPERAGRARLLGAAGAVAGALVMGMFDDIWYHGGLFWLFWAVCALLLNLSERRDSGQCLWDRTNPAACG